MLDINILNYEEVCSFCAIPLAPKPPKTVHPIHWTAQNFHYSLSLKKQQKYVVFHANIFWFPVWFCFENTVLPWKYGV